jgi:hypothetical protein
MSPIDPLGPLLAQIRAQASRLERKKGPAPSSQDGASSATARQSAPGLMDRVVAQVASLSPDLPDRRRCAFRIFLEAVLANEFAIEDASGPSCQDLVDRVLTSMERDGRLQEAIETAGEALVGMARV